MEEKTVTYEDVKGRTISVISEKGRKAAVQLLAAFGVERAYQLYEEDWSAYVTTADFILGRRKTTVESTPAKSLGALIREQQAEEQRSRARLERLRTLEVADRNCAMRPSDEIPPAPLPVEKVGGFDAFKGWAPVEWSVICQPQPMGLPSSDLQRASHQVHYEHGSAVFALEKKG